MALVGEVNEVFDLVNDLPRYLATFCDVFLLKQFGDFPHLFVVRILGHFGFVAVDTLLRLRQTGKLLVVSKRMTVYALPSRFNMLLVVEGQGLFNPIFTGWNYHSQQCHEKKASDKFHGGNQPSHWFRSSLQGKQLI
jgi:hypothetical protein